MASVSQLSPHRLLRGVALLQGPNVLVDHLEAAGKSVSRPLSASESLHV